MRANKLLHLILVEISIVKQMSHPSPFLQFKSRLLG